MFGQPRLPASSLRARIEPPVGAKITILIDRMPQVVQVDIDGRMLGIRYATELNLIGDAAETLRVLLPYLERKTDRSWRQRIEAEVAEWWRVL